MKLLVADKLSGHTLTALSGLGVEVRLEPECKTDDLPQVVGDAEILVVRSKKVTAKTIAAAANLSLIIRAGAGVDTIDVEAANARGIYVANCPGRNADAVAELAIGMLLALDRRLVDATLALREGRWQKGEFGKARGLKSRTLGLIGFGTIAQAVARRAQALDMQVLAWSRRLTAEQAAAAGVARAAAPLELARSADAISVHVAATPETRHLIDQLFFASMRPGALFVNTSRGEVVDSAAFKAALAAGRIRGATDVFEGEPAGNEGAFADTELARLATCSPHIGASTEQAAEAIAAETVRIVKVYLATGTPPNVVNLCAQSPAKWALVVRQYDRVGVLAGVLECLRRDAINVEEMQNTIFAGAQAACSTLHLSARPSEQALQAMRADPNILQLTLRAR